MSLANISKFLWVGLLLLYFTNCTPVSVVSTKKQPNTDFAAYQTYNFLDVSFKNDSMADVNRQEVQLLKNAIARQMESLGYRQSADPDLWVNIGIVVEDKVQTRNTNIQEAPVYIGQRRYHWEVEERVVDKYKQGTVTVDVVDAERRERVWEGIAAGTLTDNLKKLEKRINEAMEMLFDKYPAKSKG